MESFQLILVWCLGFGVLRFGLDHPLVRHVPWVGRLAIAFLILSVMWFDGTSTMQPSDAYLLLLPLLGWMVEPWLRTLQIPAIKRLLGFVLSIALWSAIAFWAELAKIAYSIGFLSLLVSWTFAFAEIEDQQGSKKDAPEEYEGVWEWWPMEDRLYLSRGLVKLFQLPEHQKGLFDVAQLVSKIYPDDRLLWPEPDTPMAPRWSFRLRFGSETVDHLVLVRAKVHEMDHQARAIRVVGTIENLTEMLDYEKKITQQIEVDPLTGLLNRSQVRRIEPELQKSPGGGVISIHLVNLKEVNETFGIDAGDLLLSTIGQRLGQINSGQGVALRFGGAEFLLWRSEAPELGWTELALQVVETLQKPMEWSGHTLRAKLGIGIATVSEAGTKLSELLMAAELAWRRERGKDGQIWALFSREHAQERRERRQLEDALRSALDLNQLEVYYQPKVDLDSGRIVGLEALSRWKHSEWGMVSPGRFIPVAEEAGMIHQLGMQVLEKSVAQAKEWNAKGYQFGRISVNLSPVQLKRADVLEDIYNRVVAEGASRMIELEITESAVMDDPQRSLQQMNQLVAWGIPLSMDDFGTGYSAMGTLRNFPFQILKIDLGFVRRMMDSYEDQALVQAIVQLGNKLHMKLVAEGVESEEQAEMLWRMGCQTGQGYLFSQPRPAPEIEVQLQQNIKGPAEFTNLDA